MRVRILVGRDPVDRGERILQGPNQAEDFETILFEIVDLNTRRVSHTQTPVLLVCFTSAISRVVAILQDQNSDLRLNVSHHSGLTPY